MVIRVQKVNTAILHPPLTFILPLLDHQFVSLDGTLYIFLSVPLNSWLLNFVTSLWCPVLIYSF